MRQPIRNLTESAARVERHVRSGSARLWSCASGAGTPLLMFNGGPGCDDYLGPVAAMVDDLCRVIRFEPRGCGRSDWDGNYDLDTLLCDAEAVRAAHAADRCIVAGHSFGEYVEIAGAAHTIWLTHAAELRAELRRALRRIVESGGQP